MLAAGGVFGGLHPFGLAFVLGAGQSFAAAGAAGAAVGYLALLPLTEGLRYLAAVAAALAGRWLFWKVRAGRGGGCGTLLAVQLMLSVSGLSTPAAAMGTLGDALLAAGMGWALRQSGRERALAAGPLSGTAFLLGLAALPALGGGACGAA